MAHYGFTHVTVPMLDRKLATYRRMAAADGAVSSRDAVEHYKSLRKLYEWCPESRSYQFTFAARRLAEKRYCEHLDVNASEADLCFVPTRAPRPKPTPRPSNTPRPTKHPTTRGPGVPREWTRFDARR